MRTTDGVIRELTDQEALNIREEVDKNPTLPTVVFRKHKQVGKIVSDYPKTSSLACFQSAVRSTEEGDKK